MVSISETSLRLPLDREHMVQLQTRAKGLGVRPEVYARQLIEDGLALQQEAEESSFAQIMAPVRKKARKVSDKEIVKLVEKARAVHSRGNGQRKER